MVHCSVCNVSLKVGDKHRKCVKHRKCSQEAPCVLDKDKTQEYWDGVAAQRLQSENLRKSVRSTSRTMPPLAPTKKSVKVPDHVRESVGSEGHSVNKTTKTVSMKVATSMKTGGGRRSSVKSPEFPTSVTGREDPLAISLEVGKTACQ
jgi:hypothetical protein